MQKKRGILLLGLIEFLMFIAFASANTWLVNTTINNSLPNGADLYLYKPTVFYKDSSWYLIRGRSDGDFFGYALASNGTTWLVNSTIISGLPDIGSNSAPKVFYKDSYWFLISGEYNGAFYGYRWSGTQWVVNITINASLPTLTGYSDPEIFYKDSSWYLLSGVTEGQIKGFVWSGTQWSPNSTINASLGDTGWTPSISAFYKDSSWYLIIGDDDGTFKGYVWTGTQWQSNSTIITGLPDLGDRSLPNVFFKNENWFMISGEYDNGFFGYVWNKTYPSGPLDLTSPNITFEIPTPSNTSSTSNPVTIVANISDVSSTSSWIDLDKTLVGYWSMDYYNSTGIFDNSSYNNFAIFEGGVGTGDISGGVRGNSLSFSPDENIRSYSLGANTNQTFNNSGQLTFSAWINPSGITSFRGIMGLDTVRFHVGTDSNLIATITNKTSVYNQVYSSEVLINSQWQHVALTYNRSNGNTSIYHNGSIVASGIILNANLTKTSDYFMIGQNWWDFFSGSIDEAMVFNRTLSSSEIKALYDSKSNKFNTSSIILSPGKHNYTVYAIDENGNIANSGERNFIVGGSISVSSCQVLDSSNIIYELSNDVSSSGTCFNITAQNVTIDCNGYKITYSTGGGANTYGIVTNQFNTTVKNCNIVDGNWTSTNVLRYGINLNGADNSTIFKNYIVGNTSVGIHTDNLGEFNNFTSNRVLSYSGSAMLIFNFSRNNFINNTGIRVNTTGSGYAIQFGTYCVDSTFINNTATNADANAFEVGPCSNITFVNNTGISYGYNIGINLNECNNSIIMGNNGTGYFASAGISLYFAWNNILVNNVGADYGYGTGISFNYAYNNHLTNNTATSNTGSGIWMQTSNNNTFYNNTAMSNNGSAIGLYEALNNTFIGQTSRNLWTVGSGVYFLGANNTIFRDCINVSGGTRDIRYENMWGIINLNNTFINCSFDTENVTAGQQQLIRKWYYQAYVNYSNGTAAAGANVTAYNVSNRIQFTENTNSAGWIQRKEVVEYVNTGGTRSYYNNYIINASKSGYTTDNNIWNFTITQNKINDWFTLLTSTCSYISGNWNINCSDNCFISSNYDVGGNNVSIIGAGTIIVSGNVSNYNKLHIEGLSTSNICTVRCINGGCFKG